MSSPAPNLAPLWARAGVMFGAEPAAQSPDLEQLLLDTARQASGNSRLFIMAASWLAKYGDRVCPLKLADLVWRELEPEHRPVMGLLLSTVHRVTGRYRFAAAIAACAPAAGPKPLFEVERRNAVTWRIAERRASALSREWNLWAPEFVPKFDAVRPDSWLNSIDRTSGSQ